MVGMYVYLRHGLRHRCLQHRIVALWHMHGEQAYPTAQAGTGGQDGCTCHTQFSSDEQGPAKVALMGKAGTGLEQLAHLCWLSKGIRRRCLLYALRMQAYIQHLPLSYLLRIFWQQEGQLRELKCEGEVGIHHLRHRIIGVVFPHQSRRHIDGYHIGGRGIDIAHHGGKTACQGLVQSTAEESVYHHMLCCECRRSELAGHLMKFHATELRESVAIGLATR